MKPQFVTFAAIFLWSSGCGLDGRDEKDAVVGETDPVDHETDESDATAESDSTDVLASTDSTDDTDATDESDTTDETDTTDVLADAILDDFEEDPSDVFQGISAGNWGSAFTPPPAAGAEAIYSANGNPANAFVGLALTKNLGGVIADRTYDVSFMVGGYGADNAVAFADFTTLRIGGVAGTMSWTSTPAVPLTGWVTWEGEYTPAPADLGQPFLFEVVFNLNAETSVALDGPVMATPR